MPASQMRLQLQDQLEKFLPDQYTFTVLSGVSKKKPEYKDLAELIHHSYCSVPGQSKLLRVVGGCGFWGTEL